MTIPKVEKNAVIRYSQILLDDDSKDAVSFEIDDEEVWVPRSVIITVDVDTNELTVKEWWAIEARLV